MQLSDFPRFFQRGLQATYFTWPARVTLRQLLLPQHNWLSGAGAQDCSSYKRLRRPTVSSRQPLVYASVSQHGNGKHGCCCCFSIACLRLVVVYDFFIRRHAPHSVGWESRCKKLWPLGIPDLHYRSSPRLSLLPGPPSQYVSHLGSIAPVQRPFHWST